MSIDRLLHELWLTQTDIDPEDDSHRQRDDDESSEEDESESGGREHYETVQKSKLRKPEQPRLDKKYSGVAVSRADLEDEDEDPFAPADSEDDEDPFAAADDGASESIPEEEAREEDLDESEGDERTRARPTTTPVNGVRHRALDGDDIEDDSVDNSEQDEDDDLSGSRDSDTSMEDKAPARPGRSTNVEKIRALQSTGGSESAVVSSLTSSSAQTARKGAAVQQQQKSFDRLLDTRIKLQKAVSSSNQLTPTTILDNGIQDAAAKAEAAALSLWSTINAIRCDILNQSQTSEYSTKKRKFEALEPSSSTSLSDLQAHSQEIESATIPSRQATLNHWYASTRPAAAPSESRSALLPKTDDTNISSVINTYLTTNQSKLAESSRPSPTTYDDTTFYQSLLTALIASRTNAASLPTSLPSVLPTSKNPKVKKNVDTKASKGRKIRYTVHEKLQNFMAPEDRTTWTDDGRREFFGSLFGQFTQQTDADMNGEGDRDEIGEEGALRLFRGTPVV